MSKISILLEAKFIFYFGSYNPDLQTKDLQRKIAKWKTGFRNLKLPFLVTHSLRNKQGQSKQMTLHETHIFKQRDSMHFSLVSGELPSLLLRGWTVQPHRRRCIESDNSKRPSPISPAEGRE
jgi:hypothetical protein